MSVTCRKMLEDRSRVVAVLLMLAAAGLLAVGCGGGGEGDKTFEGDGFSFTYPGDWIEFEPSESSASVGEPVSTVSLGPSEGPNGLQLNVYGLEASVTESNVEAVAAEVADVLGQVFRQAGGSMTAEPVRVTVGGLPGYSAEGTAVDPDGVRVESQVTLLFDGTTEYFLNCQFTPEHAEETKQGCAQILDSFESD
jgi:hypothetical protein